MGWRGKTYTGSSLSLVLVDEVVAEPLALALTAIMHHVRLECLGQLPTLRPVELIALDCQRTEARAHLVPNPLIAGVVDAAVEAREANLLTQILPLSRLLM